MKQGEFIADLLVMMRRLNSETGAALLEFSIVAVVMLGILLPGMISVGKTLSEINAAAQGAYIGAQQGAQIKIDLTEEATSDDIATLNLTVDSAVRSRIDSMYPLMAPGLESKIVNGDPSEVTLFRPETGDTDHWMVQADITAYFPTLLTNIPVRVKSVSSMLNVQPRRGGDLATPQRITRGTSGAVPTYRCNVTPCSTGNFTDSSCNRECCGGFLPGYDGSANGILRNDTRWLCPEEIYGPTGTLPGNLPDEGPG